MNHMFYLNGYNDFDLNITEIISICHEKVDRKWGTSSHNLNHHQLHFVFKGNFDAILNGEKFHVSQNNLFFIPAHSTYYAHSKFPPYEYFAIYFNMDLPEESVFSFPTVFVPKASEIYLNYYKTAEKIWRNKRFGYPLLAKALLYNLLQNMFSEYLSANFVSSNYPEIEDAVSYIERNYHSENISIMKLAQISHTTPNHFISLFKKSFSLTPKQYINQLRINYASELLEFSSMTIDEISQKMGYSDVSYFSRIFKKTKGVSPLQFRKNKHM